MFAAPASPLPSLTARTTSSPLRVPPRATVASAERNAMTKEEQLAPLGVVASEDELAPVETRHCSTKGTLSSDEGAWNHQDSF